MSVGKKKLPNWLIPHRGELLCTETTRLFYVYADYDVEETRAFLRDKLADSEGYFFFGTFFCGDIVCLNQKGALCVIDHDELFVFESPLEIETFWKLLQDRDEFLEERVLGEMDWA